MTGVDGPSWNVRRVRSTGSTNTDLLAAAAAGAGEGDVLVADTQTAGLGRLGRRWVTPPGSALAVSALLRPPSLERAGWLPLLAGLAVRDAVLGLTRAVGASLKWPNDVLGSPAGADGPAGKVAGLLVQLGTGPAPVPVVVGIGVNVTTPADALPAGGVSLRGLGAEVDRIALLDAVLARLAVRYTAWVAGTDPRTDYRACCTTLGAAVRVRLGAGPDLIGTAVDIDPTGRLVVAPGAGRPPVAVSAGDVTHLRLAD